MFMTAVKDSNLQAMSVVWGDKDALARDRYSADELFQRETVLVCYLANDSYRILSDAQTMDGGRVVTVEVKRRNLTRSADFNVVQGHSGRWYVFSIPNIQGLQDLCAKRPG